MRSVIQNLFLAIVTLVVATAIVQNALAEPSPGPKEHPGVMKEHPADVVAPRGGRSFKILEPISIQNPRGRNIPSFPQPGWNLDLSKDSDDLVHVFKADLRRQIRRNWTGAPSHFQKTVVQFTLLPDGSIERVSLEQSSGKRSVDKLAVRSIEKGAPYAYLPKWIKKPVALRMTFDERMSSGFAESVDAIEVCEQPGQHTIR